MSSSNALSMAKKLEIPVIQMDNILRMLNVHETSKEFAQAHVLNQPVKSLGASFIKVEDSSHNFKPCFAKFKQMPYIDFKSSEGLPFYSWYKENCKPKECFVSSCLFCELCGVNYTSLRQHLESEIHVSAATDKETYMKVDELIAKGSSLDDFLAKVRAKHNKE